MEIITLPNGLQFLVDEPVVTTATPTNYVENIDNSSYIAIDHPRQ